MISRQPLIRGVVATALMTASAGVFAQSPRSVNVPPPPPAVSTQSPKAALDMQMVLDALAGLGGKPIQTLTSANAPAGGKPMPAVAYYHGGGWVLADVDL